MPGSGPAVDRDSAYEAGLTGHALVTTTIPNRSVLSGTEKVVGEFGLSLRCYQIDCQGKRVKEQSLGFYKVKLPARTAGFAGHTPVKGLLFPRRFRIKLLKYLLCRKNRDKQSGINEREGFVFSNNQISTLF